ncbi:tRNA (adenosine(37)-N6)-threonylcarbamoyltransferase complex ATPase subunit type 1 TsaE [Patescibacteria group bacterium]
MKYITHSENETKAIGKKIASKLKGGEILALQGDLGAGKTVLTKGIAETLGYKKIVNSPTFVLMKIYKVSRAGSIVHDDRSGCGTNLRKIKYICHIDAYRLNSASELKDIGALEYFGRPDTISIVEWPKKVKEILPKNAIWIKLKCGQSSKIRKIELE